MMIGKRYRDSMDEGHVVIPVTNDGDCRHYHDGVYVGKAKVPVSLFDLDPGTERWPGPAVRYGYVIDRPAAERVQAEDGEG